MSKKAAWITLFAGTSLFACAAFLLLGHSGGSSASQRVNAMLDDAQAVGVRVLDLPLFMLLAMAVVAGAIAAGVVERFAGRGLKPARVGLGAAFILALFALAFTADRRINHMQNQISELRGKLNAQRMTMPDATTSPATEAVAAVTTPTPAPAPAAAAVAKSPGTRDAFLIDPDAIKKTLSASFTTPTLHTIIIDRASDAVELRMSNPQIVAYVSVTDLKTPGLEIQYGGNLGFKTYTSDFARTNDCSIAINGEAGQSPQANSGLGPWYGNMVSAGKVMKTEGLTNPRPFLAFDKQSAATFTAQAAKERTVSADAFNVVWGRMDAVIDGSVQTAAERDRQPRTAMGISKDGTRLILLVVDGRQQQYSIGFTRGEVGMVLSAFGAANGMLCDEGGSSCFYIKKFNGIVNSPSDGEERATYTHFGITLHNPVPL